ncbi:MAG: aquaporin [Candidatus Peribacteraceae bacterium]|nr:aquaporin [Candidatus Peribacteraceae bacterium]
MNYRPFLAELLGTFLLAFLVRLSLGAQFPVATPVLAAITLGLIVYILGSVSGAHVNPAVTIGLFTIGKIKALDALGYIIAQVIGAVLAGVAGTAMLGSALTATADSSMMIVLAEAIGAAIFLFGISAVVRKKVPDCMSGITVGTSLLLGVLAASTASAGILNPAVALALHSFTPAYIFGPIIGAVAGVWLYRAVAE